MPEPTEPQNNLGMALVHHLQLDPTKVTADGINVELRYGQMVTIRWEGMVVMSLAEFQSIVDGVSPE